MGYRKCLTCKEAKDKDTHFTIDDWHCDACKGGGGGGAKPAPTATPATTAPATTVQAPAAPTVPTARAPTAPTASSWPTAGAAPAAPAPAAPAPAAPAPAAPAPAAPKPASAPPASVPATTAATPTAKETCHKCKQPIDKQILTALEKTWHPSCFQCIVCSKPIEDTDFAILNDEPAHEDCRPKPKCHRCGKPIIGVVLTAIGNTWHEECFLCSKCSKPLARKQFFIDNDDMPVCEGCLPEPAKCPVCGKEVSMGISALDQTWHPECFACGTCGKPITGAFFPKNQRPYCSVECHGNAK